VITGKANWEEARHLIEKETGPIQAATELSEGRNSEISVIICSDGDATFIKGRKADHGQVWTQEYERIINPLVQLLHRPATAPSRPSADVTEPSRSLGRPHAPPRRNPLLHRANEVKLITIRNGPVLRARGPADSRRRVDRTADPLRLARCRCPGRTVDRTGAMITTGERGIKFTLNGW